MTEPSRIDVVIPAYNGARTLPDCLESVFSQTLSPARVLVVDDASTDDTPSVLARYGGRVETVRHPANAGAGAARNTGLAQATAPLVAFLDCNDAWEPGLLNAHAEAFRRTPTAGLHYTSLWDCNETLEPVGNPRAVPERHGVDLFPEAYLEGFPIPPSVTCVRREATLASGPYDTRLRVAEDLDFALRLLLLFPASSSPEPLARRRRHADSLTRTTTAAEHIRCEELLWRNVGAAAARHGRELPLDVAARIRRSRRLRLREYTLYGSPEVAALYWTALVDAGGGGPRDQAARLLWRTRRLARRLAGRPGA